MPEVPASLMDGKGRIAFFMFMSLCGIALVGTGWGPVEPPLSPPTGAQVPALKVITTITIPWDLTRNIGGDFVQVTPIVSGSTDIHTFSGPTPALKQQMQEADLIIAMGLEDLEPWFINTYANLNPKPTVLYLIDPGVMRVDPLVNELNPHVWLDPGIVKWFVGNITQALVGKDPAHAADYTQGRDSYLAKLDQLLSWMIGNRTGGYQFAGLKVAEHHPAFFYFLDFLGVKPVAIIAPSEIADPSAAHKAEVINTMLAEGAKIVINEPQLSATAVYDVARAAGANITELTDLLDVPDGQGGIIDTYFEMITFNLYQLAHSVPPPAVTEAWGWYLFAGVADIAVIVVILWLRRR